MPIRSASVPVFGYLSFLASSSAIAKDFIALADHLTEKKNSLINNQIVTPNCKIN